MGTYLRGLDIRVAEEFLMKRIVTPFSTMCAAKLMRSA
jgi:hypothetical protein